MVLVFVAVSFVFFSLDDVTEPKKIQVPKERGTILKPGVQILEKVTQSMQGNRTERNTDTQIYTIHTHTLKTSSGDYHIFIHVEGHGIQ